MEEIISPQNSLFKMAAALRQKKYREETGLFVIEGVRLFEEAVQADWDMTAIIGTAKGYNQPRVQTLLRKWQHRNCRVVAVQENLYAKITDTEQPQGLMGLVRQKNVSLQELAVKDHTFITVLDGVQDPGNVGTLIRVADAAGCHAVVLTKGCADLYAGKVVRATMGSLFHLPVVRDADGAALVEWLTQNGITLFATALTEAAIYHHCDLTRSVAVAFGNEGSGLSGFLLNSAREKITIPLYGQAESLNVATSAAVILYEAARQRQLNL